MKPLTSAGLGLIVGVTAMWIGGDKLKSLVSGGACCPSPGAMAIGDAGHDHSAHAATPCPAHFDGEEIVVDDKPGLERMRIALRDGIYTPWTELGRAPTKEEIGARLKLDVKQTAELMNTLESCGESMGGGILRAPQSDLIAIAWPFSNLPTGIDVTVDGGKTAHARCAIDALGVSKMLGKRVTVAGEAHDTKARVHVVVDGEQVVEAEPKDTVVYKGGSCDEMLFFSSTAAVDEWKKQNSVSGGELLTLADATKRGAEIFGRMTEGLPSPEQAAAYIKNAGAAPKHVAVWEPVDEAFRGCEGGCGARAEAAEEGVVVQTASTAQLGDKVYCPVSGVVFTVSEASAQRAVDGKPVYFCCEACAAYFSANQARVLAARAPSAS